MTGANGSVPPLWRLGPPRTGPGLSTVAAHTHLLDPCPSYLVSVDFGT